MENEFVSYEQAIALKELGFNEICFSTYTEDGTLIPYCNGTYYFPASLKQQVFRWFRKKGYDIKIQKENPGLYFGFYWTGAAWVIISSGSFEKVESACIDELIKIVKNQLK